LTYWTNDVGDRFYPKLAGRTADQPDYPHPTTRFISRAVTLEGNLEPSSDNGTLHAKGTYRETLIGLLPRDKSPKDEIVLEGTFDLTRETALPFQRRPFRFVDPCLAKLNDCSRQLPVKGKTVEQSLQVDRSLLLHRVRVLIAPALDANRTFALRDPLGGEYSLSCDSNLKGAQLLEPPRIRGPRWQPTELLEPAPEINEQLSAFMVCEPQGSLDGEALLPVWNSDLGAVEQPRDPTRGSWTLEVKATGQAVELKHWALLLYGAEVFSLDGEVRVGGGDAFTADRFENVRIQVSAGLGSGTYDPVIPVESNGTFRIPFLPHIPVVLTATKPGYLDAKIDRLDASDCKEDPRGYRYGDGRGVVLPGDTTLAKPATPSYSMTLCPQAGACPIPP
jgi:hypothetical protein